MTRRGDGAAVRRAVPSALRWRTVHAIGQNGGKEKTMDGNFDLPSEALALEIADTNIADIADSQADNQASRQTAQFLATEYAALQSARSALVVESNGRTGTFLNAISASFVALALILNISQFGGTFLLFALVLIPILGFIGLSAYVRVVQIDYAD